jgi:hypothetical protein
MYKYVHIFLETLGRALRCKKIDRHKIESSIHLAFMADANFMDNLCVYKMHDPPPILQDLEPCKDNNDQYSLVQST